MVKLQGTTVNRPQDQLVHPKSAKTGRYVTRGWDVPTGMLDHETDPYTPGNIGQARQFAQSRAGYNHARKTMTDVGSAAKSVNKYFRYSPETVEDIISSTFAEITTHFRNGNADLNMAALTMKVRSQFVNASYGDTHHVNGRAKKQWEEACEIEEMMLGRELTEDEQDDLAYRIREEWVAAVRPKEGFHLIAGLDIVATAAPEQVSDLIESGAPALGMGAPDHDSPYFEVLAAGAEMGVRAKVKDAGYRMFAEYTGLPHTRPLPRGSVNDVREAVAGNVRVLAQNHLDGDDPGQLFAPFGDSLSVAAKDAIADAFIEHANMAERLWESAVKEAGVIRRRRL